MEAGRAHAGGSRSPQDDGTERTLDDKSGDIPIRADERVVIETPGAGGLGPPAKRGAADLEADRRNGKFSAEYLARHYP